jgi:small-conductance mechanosensitive channel
VHFKDFGASSLDISVAYWYGNPDNVEFMDFSHWVNLEILRKFSAEGIQMAFPTRTVHLLGDRRGSLAKSA